MIYFCFFLTLLQILAAEESEMMANETSVIEDLPIFNATDIVVRGKRQTCTGCSSCSGCSGCSGCHSCRYPGPCGCQPCSSSEPKPCVNCGLARGQNQCCACCMPACKPRCVRRGCNSCRLEGNDYYDYYQQGPYTPYRYGVSRNRFLGTTSLGFPMYG